MKRICVSFVLLTLCVAAFAQPAQRGRIRDFGIAPGVFKPGTYNAITDVPGVKVGQVSVDQVDFLSPPGKMRAGSLHGNAPPPCMWATVSANLPA